MGKNTERGVIPILALVLVLVAVGAVAFIYYKSTYKDSSPVSQTSPLLLALESPTEGSVISDDQVLVKGKTSPNSTVVFYTDLEENSVDSDSSGKFEGTIKLSAGINTLTVTAFAENGNEKTLTLDIVNDTK